MSLLSPSLSLSASSMIADIAGWVVQFLSRLHNFQVGLTIFVLHLRKFAYQICLSLEENSDRFLHWKKPSVKGITEISWATTLTYTLILVMPLTSSFTLHIIPSFIPSSICNYFVLLLLHATKCILYLVGFPIVSAYKLLEHLHQCSVCEPGNIFLAVHISRVPAFFQWIHWIGLMNLIQDFQQRATEILNIGGDALRDEKYETNHLIINRVVVFFLQTKASSEHKHKNGWTQDALLRTLFFYTLLFA
jgi:hypothetical protein